MEIEGRTFLVAGGGSGLGCATTEMLTNEGAKRTTESSIRR